MYDIDGKFYTHLHIDHKIDHITPRKVSESDGLFVDSFYELRKKLALISFNNPRFELLFRGQTMDKQTKATSQHASRSSIYPSIFRPEKGKRNLDSTERARRFRRLHETTTEIQKDYEFTGSSRVKYFPEVAWALMQHYDVSTTPLIDLTSSITTAVTFACLNNRNEFGYLYVFGLPKTKDSISYHVDENMVSVKLSATCPPDGLRAHFQDAFFVGAFPHSEKRTSNKNLAKRMIAKFKLDVASIRKENVLWRSEDLFPEPDPMEDFLSRYR